MYYIRGVSVLIGTAFPQQSASRGALKKRVSGPSNRRIARESKESRLLMDTVRPLIFTILYRKGSLLAIPFVFSTSV